MDERIKELCRKYETEVISYRRNIHKRPELAFNEYETQNFVKSVLAGLPIETRDIQTGVIGLLKGAKPGRCIALRADMDALPMTETTSLPFASEKPGVTHACGHDMHTAMLLGAAHVLSEMKEEIAGEIKFIFQPAEESNPDCGALPIIEGGAFLDPKVDGILGLHVWPSLETGNVATKTGPIMGASDRIFIVIKGKTSHGSEPDKGIDACMISAQIITALQSIVARRVSALHSSVISIGTIKAGYRYNIIADRAEMEGTVRNTNPETRDKMPDMIEAVIKGVCQMFGAEYEYEYKKGYDATVNDGPQTRKVMESLKEIIGKENFLEVENPAMGGEDFSFYGKYAPGTYLWLGCRPKDVALKDFPPIHNAGFNPDENCMKIGVMAMVKATLDLLAQ